MRVMQQSTDMRRPLFHPHAACGRAVRRRVVLLLVGLLYMKTLENSRNVNAECVVVVGWAI